MGPGWGLERRRCWVRTWVLSRCEGLWIRCEEGSSWGKGLQGVWIWGGVEEWAGYFCGCGSIKENRFGVLLSFMGIESGILVRGVDRIRGSWWRVGNEGPGLWE